MFRNEQDKVSFNSFTIIPSREEEHPVKKVLAPKKLQTRHLSACFVVVGDSVVAIGGYNRADQNKSVCIWRVCLNNVKCIHKNMKLTLKFFPLRRPREYVSNFTNFKGKLRIA